MKIKVNYDLINKISESKNGLKLQKALIFSNCIDIPIYVYYLIITGGSIFNFLFVVLLSQIPAMTNAGLISVLVEQWVKNKANKNLDIFVNQLYNLEVKTTTELLKESKVIEKNYEINYKDNKPILIQRKYISVPLCNGYDETLLQEHNVGSRKYELSVQSPIKKHKFKLAKANTSS